MIMRNLNTNLADSSFQVRVSRKTLATLAKFMHQKGFTPRSKSELGRVAMELLKDHLVSAEIVEEFTDSAEANSFLEGLDLGPLSIRGRQAAYMKQLQKEVAVEGGILAFDPFEKRQTVEDIKKEDRERINKLMEEFEGKGGE